MSPSTDDSIPIMTLDNGDLRFCVVSDLAEGSFDISCTNAPGTATDLTYVVINLPPHVIS